MRSLLDIYMAAFGRKKKSRKIIGSKRIAEGKKRKRKTRGAKKSCFRVVCLLFFRRCLSLYLDRQKKGGGETPLIFNKKN